MDAHPAPLLQVLAGTSGIVLIQETSAKFRRRNRTFLVLTEKGVSIFREEVIHQVASASGYDVEHEEHSPPASEIGGNSEPSVRTDDELFLSRTSIRCHQRD